MSTMETVAGSQTALASGDVPTRDDLEWADEQIGERLSPERAGTLASLMGEYLRTLEEQT
jgi:hypothetical protein